MFKQNQLDLPSLSRYFMSLSAPAAGIAPLRHFPSITSNCGQKGGIGRRIGEEMVDAKGNAKRNAKQIVLLDPSKQV